MPAGVLMTVPVPLPRLLTVRLTSGGFELLNVAVTVVPAERVTEHRPVPLHPPPFQPENEEPVAGVAVSVTIVPLA